MTSATESPAAETASDAEEKQGGPTLPAAARRALAEAEERRRLADKADAPREIGGRGGLDPARYGDWEVKGRAVDF